MTKKKIARSSARTKQRPARAPKPAESPITPSGNDLILSRTISYNDAAMLVDGLRAEGSKLVPPAPKPDIPRDNTGRPTAAVEHAVLNAPRVGNFESIGDLILKVIAPGILEDSEIRPDAWEPPEGTALRVLAFELTAIAEGVESGRLNDLGLADALRALAERADASRELAFRLREARFGTSPTWGGVVRTAEVTRATIESARVQ